jgi:hypothetical protein
VRSYNVYSHFLYFFLSPLLLLLLWLLWPAEFPLIFRFAALGARVRI